jgi:hypothetical protein
MVRKLYYKNCMNNERRVFARLKRSLPITLLDSEVKSKNISPEGVYFEIITKNIENYSPGKVIMIEVEFTNSQFGLPEGTDRFIGFGEVVRMDGIDINNHDKRLGLALKFSERLKLYI